MIATDKIRNSFSIFQAEVNLGSIELQLAQLGMLKLILILSLLIDCIFGEPAINSLPNDCCESKQRRPWIATASIDSSTLGFYT